MEYTVNRKDLVDEEKRQLALKPLRDHNYRTILDALAKFCSLAGARLLEVGSAYGWFMEVASSRGVVPFGIEPDEAIAAQALQKGLQIHIGYFPACIDTEMRFDVIIFNDVLEHLPNIDKVFESCSMLLSPHGKLVINIPDSDGFIFRFARTLATFGFTSLFSRLWQEGYRSPHLVYFNSENLAKYARKHRFALLHDQALNSVSIRGLWSRIHMDQQHPSIKTVISYVAALTATILMVSVLPSDQRLHIYKIAAS